MCRQCRTLLLGRSLRHRVLSDGSRCVTSTAYSPPVRRLVLAAKEGGRRDVRRVLAHALARSVIEVGWGAGRRSATLVLVTPPTDVLTRLRRRGDPVGDLAATAAALIHRGGTGGQGTRARRLLRRERVSLDQAGLSARARWANVDGAFALRRSILPIVDQGAGVDVVVVDDVVTTGATAVEAAAVLGDSGFRVLGVAAVAG